MSEPNDLQSFDVYGLYRLGNVQTILAEDETDARRQFHDQHAGWAGTILKVVNTPEPDPEDDDG